MLQGAPSRCWRSAAPRTRCARETPPAKIFARWLCGATIPLAQSRLRSHVAGAENGVVRGAAKDSSGRLRARPSGRAIFAATRFFVALLCSDRSGDFTQAAAQICCRGLARSASRRTHSSPSGARGTTRGPVDQTRDRRHSTRSRGSFKWRESRREPSHLATFARLGVVPPPTDRAAANRAAANRAAANGAAPRGVAAPLHTNAAFLTIDRLVRLGASTGGTASDIVLTQYPLLARWRFEVHQLCRLLEG